MRHHKLNLRPCGTQWWIKLTQLISKIWRPIIKIERLWVCNKIKCLTGRDFVSLQKQGTTFLKLNNRVFLLCQIWILKYYDNCPVKKLLWFMSFQVDFFRQLAILSFSSSFGFDVKKIFIEKVNILNQQLNIWLNNWHLLNILSWL